MAKRKYDIAVFIGRFQLFHSGHAAVISEALKQADHVLIIVGSCYEPRSYRNPFEYDERQEVIWNSFPADRSRINTYPVMDTVYNDGQWVQHVQEAVWTYSELEYPHTDNLKIALIGHEKDHSSFYLKLFPQWDSISVPNVDSISSTTLRGMYFGDTISRSVLYKAGDKVLPQSSVKFLQEFEQTPDYVNIKAEYEFVEAYKSAWKDAPYEPTFVTTDACVIQSGHVLLVQRKARPGKGLWALPGGFLDPTERIQDGMIRELREETRIKVPGPVLRGNIKAEKVFDAPHRSSRGRTITHGFLINLPPDTELPKVKGSDDAAKARWWPLAEVRRHMMFEDHWDIINYFANLL